MKKKTGGGGGRGRPALTQALIRPPLTLHNNQSNHSGMTLRSSEMPTREASRLLFSRLLQLTAEPFVPRDETAQCVGFVAALHGQLEVLSLNGRFFLFVQVSYAFAEELDVRIGDALKRHVQHAWCLVHDHTRLCGSGFDWQVIPQEVQHFLPDVLELETEVHQHLRSDTFLFT